MRLTTRNIFHTSLAVHPSSLSARSCIRAGGGEVRDQGCSTTGSHYGTGGMGASSRVVDFPVLWRVPYGGNA